MEARSDMNHYILNNRTILTSDNYSEADALVLAELSYFPFEDICKTNSNLRISVSEFASHIMMQPDFKTRYSEDKQGFMKALALSPRYRRCILHDMEAADIMQSQWAAFTLDIGNDMSVVAMRGTNGTVKGWTEDLELAHKTLGTNAQLAAFRYLKKLAGSNVYLTGHSKGGSNVISAYMMSNAYVRDKIKRIDNFDGPGANPEYILNYKEGYEELKDKLHNFYPGDSIIGMLLSDYPGETVFIKARVREGYQKLGIGGQHDPFAFQIRGNEFVRDEQTDISKILNRTIDDLVKNTSNVQRFYMIQFLERIGIPELIAGESGGIAHFITNFIAGCVKTTKKGREAIYRGIKIILECLILQAKEWIALRQIKGYNIECGVSRQSMKR